MEAPGPVPCRFEGRLLVAAALAVSLAVALLGQHDRQIASPDEAREAGITLAMARTGDWVVPRLNGRPFLEKPPLFHAAGAVALEATGSRSPFAVRLPAALFALATLAATLALGRRIGGTRMGAVAVMALATTAGFYTASHRAVTDNSIPVFVVLAFLGIASFQGGAPLGRSLALAGGATGVAFLAKGAVGPAMIVFGGVAALAWSGDLKRLLDRRVVPGVLLAVLIPAAWLVALYAAEGKEALDAVLVKNNWDRASDSASDHAGGPLYYLVRAPAYLLPWFPLAILGAIRARREGPLHRLPVAWLGGGLFLLTLAAAKRPIYLLPLVPAAALLAAREIEAAFFGTPAPKYARAVRYGVAGMAVLGLLAAAAYDATERPEDLPVAVTAAAVALAGAFMVPFLLSRGRAAPAVALCFVMIAGTFTLGYRAQGPAADEERGLDALVEDIEAESRDRTPVLFRPNEALEGIATFRLERVIPVAQTAGDLTASERGFEREVLLIGRQGDRRLAEILRHARVVRRRRAGRIDYVMAVLPR